MFRELGMKLDNFLVDAQEWHRQRIWYKIYGYFYIKKEIKNDGFKNNKHFYTFMDNVRNVKMIWNWQYEKFCKMYEEQQYNEFCKLYEEECGDEHFKEYRFGN